MSYAKAWYTGISLYGLISYGPTWSYGLAVQGSQYNQVLLFEFA